MLKLEKEKAASATIRKYPLRYVRGVAPIDACAENQTSSSGNSDSDSNQEETESGTDCSLDDADVDEEELENATNQIGIDAMTANKFFKRLKSSCVCELCLVTMSTDNFEPQNFLIYTSAPSR